MPQIILGISAYFHDSAAAVLVDGKVIAAAQEERFSRVKNTAAFPRLATQYCMKEVGIQLEELDAIVFYEKPFLTFERLLETYYAFAPEGLLSFLKSMPVWLQEKLFLKRNIRRELNQLGQGRVQTSQLLFSEHHLSHAACGFYLSGYDDAAILVVDGVGEWATVSIGHGTGRTISTKKELHFPHSVGLLYSSFAQYLGFKVNSGEFKLMGLAPYGDLDSDQFHRFKQRILDTLVEVKDDGSIWLNPAYFKYATGLNMCHDQKWHSLFGFERREPDTPFETHHFNLALAIQKVTEHILILLAQEAGKVTQSKRLVLSGGVAMNCVANAAIREHAGFDEVFVPSAPGDAGGAIGAALVAHHLHLKEPRAPLSSTPSAPVFLGPDWTDHDVQNTIQKFNAKAEHFDSTKDMVDLIAHHLSEGKVVGWFQGRMEFGARALGNRSILADPRPGQMKDLLNHRIKQREGFRPFAPAVLEEDMKVHFELDQPSPSMSFAVNRAASADSLPLEATTHVDGTARVQTVHPADNPQFHALLLAFKRRTSCGVLLNTSFNQRGEPMVCSPEDAFRTFMSTELDTLVIQNFVLERKDQPDWQNRQRWNLTFDPD
jgi:carbamoyltransferase